MKKVVIFDFDGVIINQLDLGLNWMRYEFEDMTDDLYSELNKTNFLEAKSRLKKKIIPEAEYIQRTEDFRSTYRATQLCTGIPELPDELNHMGLDMAINSSTNGESCHEILSRNNVRDHFSLLTTKEIAVSKITKFNLIQEHYKTTAAECLFVTDTVADLIEATHSGIDTVAVTWGLHTPDDFANYPSVYMRGFAQVPSDIVHYL